MLKSVEPDISQSGASPAGDRARPAGLIARTIAQTVLMLVVLAASVAAMDYLVASKPERPPGRDIATVYPIEAQTIVSADHRPIIRLYGQAVAARTVELRPLVAGEVISVSENLRSGARVSVAEPLLEIDGFDYRGALAEARSNLAQTHATIAEINAQIESEDIQRQAAQNQLDIARRDLERARQLNQRGSLTAKQVDERVLVVSQREQAVSQRSSNLAVQQARLDQQEASLERLEWRVEQAERNIENTVLRAPFDAVVRAVAVEVGKNVSGGDIVATLYSGDDLEARFTLTDAQFGRVANDSEPLIGRPVTAIWSVGDQEYRFEGTLVRLGADIVSERGGIEVFAALHQDAEAVTMRPGAFLELTLPDRIYSGSQRVPESAVYGGDRVYAVEDGKLTERIVTVAAYDGTDAIVTGGLSDGEVVMTTRLSNVATGLLVSVRRLDGEDMPTVARQGSDASAPDASGG